MDIEYPRLLLWAFATIVLVALVVGGSTSGAAFGLFNPGWDGASELRSQADAVGVSASVVRDVPAYNNPRANETVAIILSPDRAYTPTEADHVQSFVRNGGTLVVTEDFGTHSNPLLAHVGADARLDGRLLRDERHFYRSPAMPVARNVSSHSLTEDVGALTLNHGTVVVPHGARVLVHSSGYGYIDANRNGDLDDNETLGSYPVATVEQIGEGHVIVVSDPSIAINAMVDRPGNRQFIRTVFAGHDQVLLDYSHAEQLPPLSAALLIVRESALLQLLIGGLVILGIAVWVHRPETVANLLAAVRRRLTREHRVEAPFTRDTTFVAYLAERYPDWDRERLQRVVRATRHREETEYKSSNSRNG